MTKADVAFVSWQVRLVPKAVIPPIEDKKEAPPKNGASLRENPPN